LLDSAPRPIPDIEVTSCFFRNDLQDGLELSSPEGLLITLLLPFPPEVLLFTQPGPEVAHHRVLVTSMEVNALVLGLTE
jgi:hypothetical protein